VFRARKKVALSSRPKRYWEIAQLEAEIDRVEAQTIERLATPPDNQVQQLELLGKLMPGAARQHSARHHRRFARGRLQFNRATIAGLALGARPDYGGGWTSAKLDDGLGGA